MCVFDWASPTGHRGQPSGSGVGQVASNFTRIAWAGMGLGRIFLHTHGNACSGAKRKCTTPRHWPLASIQRPAPNTYGGRQLRHGHRSTDHRHQAAQLYSASSDLRELALETQCGALLDEEVDRIVLLPDLLEALRRFPRVQDDDAGEASQPEACGEI